MPRLWKHATVRASEETIPVCRYKIIQEIKEPRGEKRTYSRKTPDTTEGSQHEEYGVRFGIETLPWLAVAGDDVDGVQSVRVVTVAAKQIAGQYALE